MRRILSFGAGQDFIDDCEGFLTRNGFGLEAYKGKARTGAVGDGAPILLVFDGSLRKDDEAGLDAMLSMDRRLPVVLVSDGPQGTPQSSQVKARYVLQRGFRKKDLLAAARGCAEVLELMERAERLGNELKLRNSELSYVLDIGRTLASSFDLPKVLPKIMDPLRQMVSAEAWSVMLMSNDESELVLEAAKARPGKRVKQFRLKLGQGEAGMAALDRAPKVVPDVARYGDFDASLDAATGWKTRSVMAVPIISKGRLLGVMELINKQDPKGFSGSDLELVSRLLGQAAIAIEQAEMYRKMADLVITDDLTKLFNLRYLERTLEVEVERSMRYGLSVAVIFMDIDYFKKVNDRFGHLVGSKLLVEISQLILKSLRRVDIVARYGGDEFVIVLPQTDVEAGRLIAERLRKNIERNTFLKSENLSLKLTASFGIACYPQHAGSKEDLIRLADEAMYRVKYHSRNSVYVVEP